MGSSADNPNSRIRPKFTTKFKTKPVKSSDCSINAVERAKKVSLPGQKIGTSKKIGGDA